MGSLANKKKIKDILKKALTVGKLKEILSKYPDNMIIGKVDYYGEYNAMNEYNFTETSCYVVPDTGWSHNYQERIEIIDITVPDISESSD